MQLIQKRLFDQRTFTLGEKEVTFVYETLSERIQATAKYEEIGQEKAYVKKRQPTWNWLFWIAGATVLTTILVQFVPQDIHYILQLVWFLVVIYCLIEIYDSRKTMLLLTGGQKNLSFLADQPNEKEVEAFVEELNKRIQTRMIFMHVRLHDDEMPQAHKEQNLKRLLEADIINEEKYQEVLTELQKSDKGQSPIHFGRR